MASVTWNKIQLSLLIHQQFSNIALYIMRLIKVVNNKKKTFDHSNEIYYKLELDNGSILLFTAFELNKALERYKSWVNKTES